MRRRLPAMLLVATLAAACGSSGPTASPATTAAPSQASTPSSAVTSAPSAAPSVQPTGPFDGQPYAVDLPEGWTTFDLQDPSGKAALDAFVAANPEMAGAIEAFKALPNVTMAVNLLLGNVFVSLSLPTGGLPLETIAGSFTSQFGAVPGIKEVPEPENVTLPIGPAVHWLLTIEANDPGGGVSTVKESIYLVANDTTAVLVEFVDSAGGGIPQESQIIQTLRFTP